MNRVVYDISSKPPATISGIAPARDPCRPPGTLPDEKLNGATIEMDRARSPGLCSTTDAPTVANFEQLAGEGNTTG